MRYEKTTLAAIAILVVMALGTALASQHLFDMPPCAWCVLQRMIYLMILGIALLGLLLPSMRRTSLGLITLGALTGVGVAVYQVTVASKSLSCDLTLADRIITSSGLDTFAPWLFGVYGSCLDAVVEIFGLEYAIWSLILFAALGTASAMTLMVRHCPRRNQD